MDAVVEVQAHEPSWREDPQAAMTLYRQRGFHIESGLWKKDQLDRMSAAALRLEREQTSAHIMQNPHQLAPEFMQAARSPQVVETIALMVGGPIVGLQGQLFLGRPGAEGYAPHQDNFFVRTHPDAFVTAWHALENVDMENGGLFVYPGSHSEEILPVDPPERPATPQGEDPHVARQHAVLPEGRYSKTAVRLAPGDVLFIHAHLVHGSYGNHSKSRSRLSFVFTYLREGAPFRAGVGNKRQPFAVA